MNAAYRYACFLFLAFALDTGPLSSSSAPVEIPFEYSSKFGLMLVKAEVNGKPAVLVLDTGSNQTIVSSTLVVVKQGSLTDSTSTAKGSGYSGTGVFATASLRIGPLNWRNHRILVMEMRDFSKSLGQDVDGILGMDLLQEFDTVTVDLRHHRLLLR
jgi:predicted aspartyl protease